MEKEVDIGLAYLVRVYKEGAEVRKEIKTKQEKGPKDEDF